jgi:chromosome partitioning protein
MITIAVMNQKGGVGKTTSVVSLASEFSLKGYRTLIIDIDPQASASSGLGVELLPPGEDIYDMFFGRISLAKLVKPTMLDNLFIVPSSKDCVGLEIELGKSPGRELILKSELSLIKNQFDYVFIDCPPSSGLLSLNALGAADYMIVPLQAEYYALEGLSALMGTLEFVKQTFNQKLEVLGVFLTMYDARTNLSNQVENEARSFFKNLMFSVVIPRNIRISESPSHALPICLYDPDSNGAKAYKSLANEIEKRCNSKTTQVPLVGNL